MVNKLKDSQRVVVTGLGVISSIGLGWEEFWKSLLAGKSGISRIESFDTSQYDRHFGGEIKNFDPLKFMSRRRAAQMGRASQMALAAAKLALKDAGISPAQINGTPTAVCVGTTMGEQTIVEEFTGKVGVANHHSNSSLKIPASNAGSIAPNIALELKLTGVNLMITAACSSGNYAIGWAYDLIRSGKTNFTIAGGVDAFARVVYTGFTRLYAMAPEKCQPFDKNRKGMMAGEAAGVLFLETLESAKKRKARIYAEVLGYGLSCDAHHMTNPSVNGITRAIKKALNSTQINSEQVDYVSAHGTGTPENDAAECAALYSVFGEKLKQIPVSSVKSMLGHTMGAASALEAIVCCLVIKDGMLPPTINYETPDPECVIDCVPNKARKHKVNLALNNSSAFGGNNCCLVLQTV